MRVIRKYVLDERSRDGEGQAITMPYGSMLLDVQMQGCRPVLWALVDVGPRVRTEERRFILVKTGEERDDFARTAYKGTFQNGTLVYHLFEKFGEEPF